MVHSGISERRRRGFTNVGGPRVAYPLPYLLDGPGCSPLYQGRI